MESADLPTGEELDGIEGDVREKIYADICERVADNPPESWPDINDELAEAYQQEAEQELDEYSEAVDQAAYSHLEDVVKRNHAPHSVSDERSFRRSSNSEKR